MCIVCNNALMEYEHAKNMLISQSLIVRHSINARNESILAHHRPYWNYKVREGLTELRERAMEARRLWDWIQSVHMTSVRTNRFN